MGNLVCGIGINDTSLCGPSCTSRSSAQGKVYLPEYDMWKTMITRCSDKEKSRRPSSKDSQCAEQWLHRYNFQKWYFQHEHFTDNSGKTLQLDKDLLYINIIIYDPDTCLLIPQYVNSVFRSGTRTEIPWVYYNNHLKSKPYRASVFYDGKHYEAGTYSTALEGHLAAQLMKIETLTLLQNRYSEEDFVDSRVLDSIEIRKNLLLKYNSKKRVCQLF